MASHEIRRGDGPIKVCETCGAMFIGPDEAHNITHPQ